MKKAATLLPVVFVVALTLTSFPSGVGGQERPFWQGLQPGGYEVGFTRIWKLDDTRVWPRSPALDSLGGTVARPIRIDVWYPASCSGRERMDLEGYLEMESPAPEFEDLVFLTHRWDEYSYRSLAPDSTAFDRLVGAPTAACRDGDGAAGRFPLVVYSAGWYNRAPDNTVLAEYLASHGFVFATVPQLNPGLWTFEFGSDARSVENQVRDVEVALGTLIDTGNVDRRRVAAVGYSTGGDVALLVQGRNPLVDVVVGLDPSWAHGAGNDVAASPFFRPEEHDGPVCVLRRVPDGREAADQVLESLSGAPRLLVELAAADHGTFSDDPVQRRFLGTGSADGDRAHETFVRTVLTCLDSALVPGSGSFDGEETEARIRASGTDVRFLSPKPGPGGP